MKRMIALVVTALALAACGINDVPETPQETGSGIEELSDEAAQEAFEEWLNAENEGDCALVKSRVTQPDSVDCDLVKEQAGSWANLVDDEGYLAEYTEVTLNNESAVIEVEDHTDEILSWDMERVDGRWLIVTDADDA